MTQQDTSVSNGTTLSSQLSEEDLRYLQEKYGDLLNDVVLRTCTRGTDCYKKNSTTS